jgi:hypothetical protein
MKAGFIKEHQTLACHPSNLLAKQLARRSVSLCRHQTLFYVTDPSVARLDKQSRDQR